MAEVAVDNWIEQLQMHIAQVQRVELPPSVSELPSGSSLNKHAVVDARGADVYVPPAVVTTFNETVNEYIITSGPPRF